MNIHTLQNNVWQAGILPDYGGGMHFGRVRYNGIWVDVLRPPTTEDKPNPSNFLMLPWANRIRDGVLRFDNESYQLQTAQDDGTARHGDVRKRAWQVVESSETKIHLRFESANHDDFNFPFALRADATYKLDENDFIWHVELTNNDTRPFPAGFGFHPYFVHSADNMPLLQVPCDQQFILTDALADAAPIPILDDYDFRTPRSVTPDMSLDDLLTHRTTNDPVRLLYQAWNIVLEMHADAIFKHVLVFTAPDGSLAVEPQTNANDGFNLYADGVDGSGVFVLQPDETVSGTVRLRMV